MPSKRSDLLTVPGARLHYEVRGNGPALLLIPGSNGDAGLFDVMAEPLADRYTVISYDRRGFSRSPLSEPLATTWIEAHLDDARALLDTVAGGQAYVFGSSAGAVIGLALVCATPNSVPKLVAHEPPLTQILPDAAKWRAFFEAVHDRHQGDGAGPAMHMFMAGIGLDAVERPTDVDPELIARISANTDFFLRHEVREAPGHRLELATLDAQRERVILAGGERSREHFPYRPVRALADRWGRQVVDFPGDHTGYWSRPVEFVAALADILA